MNQTETYLTAEGAEKIKIELEYLKSKAREELAKRLRDAIQQGDLSENADYISAKEEQGFLEGRIIELEYSIKNAVIIDEIPKNYDTVSIGSTVTIQEEDDSPEVYYLVGTKEADPRQGRISHESPIGKALLNHKVGDEVVYEAPIGAIHLKIMKIE